MKTPTLALAALALLAIPFVALAGAPLFEAAPAVVPASAAHLETASAPASSADAPPADLLRVVVNNTGGAGHAVLEIDDALGVPVLIQTISPGHGTVLVFDVPAKSSAYTVSLHGGVVSGLSKVRMDECVGRALEVDFETGLGPLQWSLGVGHKCLAGKA